MCMGHKYSCHGTEGQGHAEIKVYVRARVLVRDAVSETLMLNRRPLISSVNSVTNE